MFYYKPYPEAAYTTIKDIHFVVPTGRFIRNIHRWAANIMVVTVMLHMARFLHGVIPQAREFNWLIGMGLLVVTLGLSFTGYLLPWDQLAYWAITIGANIAQSPREVTNALGITQHLDLGGFQRQLLLGSDVVGEEALIRFYLLHVMLLPLILVTLMAVHFWRIRKDGGLSRPADADKRLGPPPGDTYPVFTKAPQKTYHLAAIVAQQIPRRRARPGEHLAFYAASLLWRACGVHADDFRLPGARAGRRRTAQGTGQSKRSGKSGEGAVVLSGPPGTRVVLGLHGRHWHPDGRCPRLGTDSVSRSRRNRHGPMVWRAGRLAAGQAPLRSLESSRRWRWSHLRFTSAGCASGSRAFHSS